MNLFDDIIFSEPHSESALGIAIEAHTLLIHLFRERSESSQHTLHLQPEPGAQSAARIQLADCVTGRVVKVEAIVSQLS
jgi:hypothetical protein